MSCWRALLRPGGWRAALRRLHLFLVLGLCWWPSAGTVCAQATPAVHRTMEMAGGATGIQLSYDASGFAGPAVMSKLESGLPQTFVVRSVAYGSKPRRPLAVAAQTCRVVYDLWEGSYRVQIFRRGQRRDLLLRHPKRVIDTCLNLRALPLVFGPGLAPEKGVKLTCEVVVELNPMSQATVNQIRRWLSRSSAEPLQGDAFFGSFVSVFVGRDLGAAERSAAYRSQPWVYRR